MNSEKTANKTQGQRSMQEALRKLGERIRAKRKRKGLSQEGFADLCGLHRTEMGLLECGKTIPRLDTLLLVSQHLGLSVSDLLQGLSHEQEKVEDRDG
jgi:transcriptional regulator with XRE-family HTH domain